MTALISYNPYTCNKDEFPNYEDPHLGLHEDKFVDIDGDGFSKWFEDNISNTSDSVPNDRYVIMVTMAGRIYEPIDQMYKFLTQKARIPESNVVDLGMSNNTFDNFTMHACIVSLFTSHSHEHNQVFFYLL